MTLLTITAVAAEAAGHGGEAEATLLGLGPEGWVYVGISIFFLIAVFGAKAHRQVLGALDAQIAETRRTLDEAAAIRAEAEALLVTARRQQAETARDAAVLIDHARHEADIIVARAKADTAALITRREKMAEDKIAAAERTAVETLRAQAADAATAAARGLIAAGHGPAADKVLIDEAIAAL